MVTTDEIRVMRQNGDVNALLELLGDDDITIKKWTVKALGYVGDDKATEPLIHVLKNDDDIVRKLTVEALGNIKDKKAVVPLSKLLKDESKQVRAETAFALGEIGDKKAVAPLVKALYHNDFYIKSYVAEALGKIGDKRAVQPLIKTLKVNKGFVRWFAAEALGRLGEPEAIDYLEHLINDDAEYEGVTVSAKAQEAIKIIRSAESQRKLQQARNYEIALREDDALRIYESLDMKEDVKRIKIMKADLLMNVKDFDGAAQLFEDLGMWERAGRVRKKQREYHNLIKKHPRQKFEDALKFEKAQKFEDAARIYEELELWEDAGRVRKEGRAQRIPGIKVDIGEINRSINISDSVVQKSEFVSGHDLFNNCPYCGKKFSIPKLPLFCPFCNERLLE